MSKEDDDFSVDNSNRDGSEGDSDSDSDSEEGDPTALYPGKNIIIFIWKISV